MKKRIAALCAAACLLLSACGMAPKEEELSDEEVVNTLVRAFQAGDYEGMKPYLDDENPLHKFFANMDESTGGDMAPVYRACYEKLKAITCTAKAVEGEETWGTVDVTVSIPNFSAALHQSMADALTEDVETGSGGFYDMPAWALKAMESSGETLEETYQLHVGSRDGEMVLDTNTNRQFFAALCGGMKSYLNASMTTCTFLDGTVWIISAQGDEITGVLRTENVPGAGAYAPEDLESAIQAYTDSYASIDGVCASGEVRDDLLISRLGIDMETASSFSLVQMGLIDKQTTAGSNGWLSLDVTMSGFTREGASCVTETFKAPQPEESSQHK